LHGAVESPPIAGERLHAQVGGRASASRSIRPIDDQHSLVAWYLTSSQAFDAAVRHAHCEFTEVDFDHATLRGGRAH
jgi:hypothetical protein